MAARALFAFEAADTEMVEGRPEPTKDALLGALLRAEERAVALQFAENFAKFVELYVKVQKVRGRKKK